MFNNMDKVNELMEQAIVTGLGDQTCATAVFRKSLDNAKGRIQGFGKKLEWAQGILALFGAQEWTYKEYDELQGAATDAVDAERLKVSRRIHFDINHGLH